MIFNSKPISEITDDEIDSLVKKHKSEHQHLEFKVTVNDKEDSDKLELLRDIASLANGGGGYLIVGIRDDGKGKAQKYEPTLVGDTEKIKTEIIDLCNEHILERIDDLEIMTRKVKDNPLVIVRIPESTRIPHMVTYKNRTDFYSRYSDVKREMTLGEIKEALNRDIVPRKLSDIETYLRSILSVLSVKSIKEQKENTLETIKSDKSIEKQSKNILETLKSETIPQFLEIKSGKLLADATVHLFENDVNKTPYFWIAITPDNPKENLIDVELETVRQLITKPPGSRHSGWNMEGLYPIERFGEGIRCGKKDFEYLEVFENGHIEFWTPLNEHFCWKQSPEEFQRRPRLWPYPVAEYPSTFLRLYKALIEITNIKDDFLIDLQYRNVKGYILSPYAPETIGFRFPDREIKPFNGDHLKVPRKKVAHDFKPDKTAYELLRTIYASFGLESQTIPFFNSQKEEFNFPS